MNIKFTSLSTWSIISTVNKIHYENLTVLTFQDGIWSDCIDDSSNLTLYTCPTFDNLIWNIENESPDSQWNYFQEKIQLKVHLYYNWWYIGNI